jgi:hypothetical protein
MTNRTAWTPGNLGPGTMSWTAGFGSEIATLANGSSVMSTLVFDNTSFLDEFIDFSFLGTIASSTIGSGSALGIWLATLQGDNGTYGDGRLAAGTPAAYTPPWPAMGGVQFQVGTTVTSLVGDVGGLGLRPIKFRLVAQNISGFNFTAAQVYLNTYNQNLNN